MRIRVSVPLAVRALAAFAFLWPGRGDDDYGASSAKR